MKILAVGAHLDDIELACGGTLAKAIKLLEAEYDRAQKLKFIHNPLAYALYQVWKKADAERKE